MDDKKAEQANSSENPEGGDNRLQETASGRLARQKAAIKVEQAPGERGGRDGPEPTRYGDWEKKGIISDF